MCAVVKRLRRTQTKEVAWLFSRNERRGRCTAVTSRRGRRLLLRRMEDNSFMAPVPGLYVRSAWWQQLSVPEKALAVVRGQSLLHPDWTFCSISAALVHGLEVCVRDPCVVYIAVTRRQHTRSSERVVRRVVDGDKATTVDGVRVTSLWATAFEAMRDSTFGGALAVADSVMRREGIGRRQLAERLDRAGWHKRGKAAVLECARWADPAAENGGESYARGQMIEQGFAVPDLQVPFEDPLRPGHTRRPDFLWELPDGSLVAGELDGYVKYADPQMSGGSPDRVVLEERRREAGLTLALDAVLRLSWEEALDARQLVERLELYQIPRSEPAGAVLPSSGILRDAQKARASSFSLSSK